MNVIDVYSKTTTKEGFKYSLMKAFCDGVNKIKDQNWIANLVDNYEMSNGDYAFCFNYQRDIPEGRPGLDLRKKIIQRYEPSGKIFYYDSNVLVSYEKVKHHPITSYVRIAYGNVYPDKAKYFNNHPSPERWNIMKERLKIKIKDYDKSGDQIYICCNRGSGGYSAFGQNAAQWAIETTQQLRQYTKRPIVIRLHSGQGYPTFNDDAHRLYEFTKKLKDVDVHSPNGKYPSLLEEIKKSYAVVIFTSTSGAPAIIEGKPLFVTHQSSYLYSMNAGHLSEIENPNLNLDRNNFLYGLGESHWTLQDIENGLYFKKFLENII